jgi:Fe-S-cluster containining protein
MQHSPFPPLPCYPCPHHSACCAHGTTLSDEEGAAIIEQHGRGTVYRDRRGDWRTRVVKGRCVFLFNNTCSIYAQPYYPAVCRGFPWIDAETGGPYEFDRGICPEFKKHPGLWQINAYERRKT